MNDDAPSAVSSPQVKLPKDMPCRPGLGPDNANKFKEPVKWLLGDQIIADLKLLVLTALYGSKLDSRDWMTPDLIRFLIPEQQPNAQTPSPANTPEQVPPVRQNHVQTKADRMQALSKALRIIELPHEPKQCGIDPEQEFWFDYLADTGDGQRATYNVAYASMSHLMLDSTEIGAPVKQAKSEECEAVIKNGATFLPRGRFQFIGGDTSYNVAEYSTLVERFQTPFYWAYKDLVERKYLSSAEAEYPRPLFGIPGNHDYYDALDGFNRQFRQPITEKLCTTSDYEAPLHIPAFQRFQQASYVALQLPFGWWLWGLDTENDELDFRQKEFFKSLPNPPKLIVATPVPTTYFGRQARLDDKLTEIFKSIGLELPFLNGNENLPLALRRIPDGKCRLDLSGDIHHYARYWGPPAQKSTERCKDGAASKEDPPHAKNYASVMAGGGGASFHPSDTDIGEIQEQVLYPPCAESRSAVFKKLFNPWAIVNAGKVWLLGIIMACFVYFAVTVPQSGREAFNTFTPWQFLKVAQPGPIMPTARSAAEQLELQREAPTAPLHETFIGEWKPDSIVRGSSEKCAISPDEKAPLYFWGTCEAPRPLDYSLGVVLAFLSLVTILFGAMRAGQILGDDHALRVAAERKANDNKYEKDMKEEDRERKAQGKVAWRTTVELSIIAAAALLMLSLGISLIRRFLMYVTPFGNSLLVFLTILVAAIAVFIAFRYEEWRFKLISRKKVGTLDVPKFPTYLLWVLAIGSIGAGLWFFGRNNLAAYLASDILLCLFVLLIMGGLTLLAVSRGQELNGGNKSFVAFLFTPKGLLFALIGWWHASLQLLVPLFLMRRGNKWVFIYAISVLALFIFIGSLQARIKSRKKKLNNRATLLTLWFIFGALMLFWPLALDAVNEPTYAYGSFAEVSSRLLAVGLIGALMSCVWVGWYLAVMLSFNAHNSEAGGAARLEGFNEFIRIKLTPDSLTAYVIGFNDAKADGKDLDLRLIDSFTLRTG